jgi:membrane-associated phospholipid phosphatase
MTQGQQRVVRGLWTLFTLGLIVTAGGIAGLDAAIARWTATLPNSGTWWDVGTYWLDIFAFKELSNFLLGFLLLVAGGLLLLPRSMRSIGWTLVYVGAVQFASTVIADLSKPQMGRLRPFEAMANPGGTDTWFVGANSFPSGHVAFYAGLFLPLMMLAPRWSLLWAIPPIFVAIARVLDHDHYVSDVTASLALAAALTIGLRFLLEKADLARV